MFSHTWKCRSLCQVSAPIDPTGSAGCAACAEQTVWKRFDTQASHASGLLRRDACLVFWGYRSPVLHWVPPCGVYSSQTQSIIANTCLAEGGYMCSYMLKGCGMPNSTGTIFCSCLASSNIFTLLEEPLRPLPDGLLRFTESCFVGERKKNQQKTKFDWGDGHKATAGFPLKICTSNNLGLSTTHYCGWQEQLKITIPKKYS